MTVFSLQTRPSNPPKRRLCFFSNRSSTSHQQKLRQPPTEHPFHPHSFPGEEISFNFFHSEDVVRHPVVARIVNAYEAWEEAEQKRKAALAAERKREEQEQK